MATPAELTERERARFERNLARLRASPEERARILAGGTPFDYEAWVREAGPAAPEELAEMDQFLRERDEERRRSLVCEEDWPARPEE